MAPIDRKPGAHALPSNYLRACLLLLLADGPSHGYQLLSRTRDLFPVPLDSGRLYRQLRAMEGDTTVASSWEGSGSGPDRRVYSLTTGGADSLRSVARAVAAADSRMDTFLSRHEGLPGRRSAAA